MSSPATTVRQRGGQSTKKAGSVPPPTRDEQQLNDLVKPEKLKATIGSEWDYKLGLAVITTLAFITRFWGIGHPNEVVFDEVHFGKVSRLPASPEDRLEAAGSARGGDVADYECVLTIYQYSSLRTISKGRTFSMFTHRLGSSSSP